MSFIFVWNLLLFSILLCIHIYKNDIRQHQCPQIQYSKCTLFMFIHKYKSIVILIWMASMLIYDSMPNVKCTFSMSALYQDLFFFFLPEFSSLFLYWTVNSTYWTIVVYNEISSVFCIAWLYFCFLCFLSSLLTWLYICK